MADAILRFSDYELDFARRELRRGRTPVELPPTPLRVLLYLAEHRDRTVPRQELLDAVWPGVVVGDEVVTRALSEVRRAVGDQGDAQRVIRTLKGLGIRFVAEVAVAPGEPMRAAAPTREQERKLATTRLLLAAIAVAAVAIVAAFAWRDRGGLTPIRSIAVLPLTNLSGDPAQEYYADGMTETLIAELAKLPGVRVVSRASVMQFKGSRTPLPEIARTLKVDGVIEGSVMRAGNDVRITAQLVDTRDDRHVWGEQYDRELARVLEIQREVARAVAAQISIALTPQQAARLEPPKPVDSRAQDTYFRALALATEDPPGTIRLLEEAVSIDPDFAAAWAALAIAHSAPFIVGFPDYDRGSAAGAALRARDAARRALALAPELGDAHAAMGLVHDLFDWDWPAAERELRAGVKLSSADPIVRSNLAFHLLFTGRHGEAIAEHERWLAEAPNTKLARWLRFFFLYNANQPEQLLLETTRALEAHPDDLTPLGMQWMALDLLGRYAETVRGYERFAPELQRLQLAENAAAVVTGWRTGGRQGYFRAWETIATGNRDWFSAAGCAAIRGDHDAAFAYLERTFEVRDPSMRRLIVDPWLAPLHSDPRFADLARRMDLPVQKP
jgi:TolB-like protein/DNA-binding winged helix-turn-helix (wHTH) protein